MLKALSPLRVVVMSSHRSPGLLELLDDPVHGELFEVVALISSEEQIADAAEVERRDVSVVHHPIRPFMEQRGFNPFDLTHRHIYDQQTNAMLEILEPDLVILSSYLYKLTPVLLTPWTNQILNIHDSDLTLRGEDGLPLYRGLRSTRDAILAGEAHTRTSVHLVTEGIDTGPVLLRSEPFPVSPFATEARTWNDEMLLKAYIRAHRAWMFRSAWPQLLRRAIEVWASFEILIINDHVYVDGYEAPLPDVECLGARAGQPALSFAAS